MVNLRISNNSLNQNRLTTTYDEGGAAVRLHCINTVVNFNLCNTKVLNSNMKA